MKKHERMSPGGIQEITIDIEDMKLTQEQKDMIESNALMFASIPFSSNKAIIAAANNLNVLASKDTYQSSTQTKEVTAYASIGTAGPSVSAGGSFSVAANRSSSYQNSLIQAGDLYLYSGSDTLIAFPFAPPNPYAIV